MSADNWAECPICVMKEKFWKEQMVKGKTEEIRQNAADDLENYYANLDADYDGEREYIECVREDYEIGIGDDGKAFVIYSGLCQICGASWSFEKDGILPEDEEDVKFILSQNKK